MTYLVWKVKKIVCKTCNGMHRDPRTGLVCWRCNGVGSVDIALLEDVSKGNDLRYREQAALDAAGGRSDANL